ncbi:universal stress protein [Serratia rubidaea]|uniref:universal stress protein n=1 Tax=Serratia rubidaea TaxID=61652 RepID=UPI0017806114|nr:universal stress protein [Serratia rubidaea]MBD8451716.1 universal stress protein [Serratia rubidaea]
MAYQHIVVATDLGENAAQLLQKGAELASALQAKLSLIYIDIHHTGYYAELGIGVYNYTDKKFSERAASILASFKNQSPHPIAEVVIGRGELSEELNNAAQEKGFDLIIFGHHHDLWSRLFSATRQAINNLQIDVLVIPIED